MNEPVPRRSGTGRYSETEQEHYRTQFAPMAARYRAYARSIQVTLGLMVALGISSQWEPLKAFLGWILGASLISVIFVVLLARKQSRLACPACGEPLFSDHCNIQSRVAGTFCPMCGAPGLKPGNWITDAHCDACGEDLRRGQRCRQLRYYPVRACTHCGLFLDQRGL